MNTSSGDDRRYGMTSCPYCGKKFQKSAPNKVYCSDRCGSRYRAQGESKEAAEREARKPAESLVEVARKARAAGLTYGQYMAARAVGRR